MSASLTLILDWWIYVHVGNTVEATADCMILQQINDNISNENNL